jgi:hypothetical protein
MKEWFYTLCYMFLGAGAAFAVTAILLPWLETANLISCNICVILFIYYNGMALNDPTKEKKILGRAVPCRL